MKPLYLSFAPPEKWRNPDQAKKLEGEQWQNTRKRILERDNYTCAYCGYSSLKYQIVDHIDGDPENNSGTNLQIVCQMCNLIKHSGQGCEIKGIVDLYRKSRYNQNDLIRLTREMRDKGKNDNEIISFLGLQYKTGFRMERSYLKELYGFVTSRKTQENDMYNGWLKYHQKMLKWQHKNTEKKESEQKFTETKITDW